LDRNPEGSTNQALVTTGQTVAGNVNNGITLIKKQDVTAKKSKIQKSTKGPDER
jgi:hypothetical protein